VTLPELERLVEVMARLRHSCPWDAQQTHRSLVQYLIEETAETVEAIEADDHELLREELGDLLLQVIFHAEIAGEQPGGFDVEDVARGIADKLVARHPYVFASGEVPSDLNFFWEQGKAAEKGRSSVLQGIPDQLSALARANKIISRSRSRRVDLDLPDETISAEQVGEQIVALVSRAQACGVDPDQAVRDEVRRLERQVVEAESAHSPGLADGHGVGDQRPGAVDPMGRPSR
jgi:XTP/dITP diphosphohydrolase